MTKLFLRRRQSSSLLALTLVPAVFLGGHAAAVRAETPPPSSATMLRWEHADIAAFRERFLDVDRAFTKETRATAERRLSKLDQANVALSPVDFAIALCRVAALADNAHTGCLPIPQAQEICRQFGILDGGTSPGCILSAPDFIVPEANSVSLRFVPYFGDNFNVVATKAEDSVLLGARVVAVDGRSIESIRTLIRSFHGGTEARRDLYAAESLASPDQLRAVGIGRSSAEVSYRFLAAGGQILERTFKAQPPDGAPIEWKSIMPADHVSWAFQDHGKAFRWRDAPEINAVVIQLRQNVDAGDQKIADFLEEVESDRERLGRENIVLDMRFNGGGNFLLTRGFMMRWPARLSPPGRFFVLTSRNTFSAGIASIAYLKQAGNERVVLVGEAPGDRLTFFSEGRPIQLPHSGLFFSPTTARQDYHTGCRTYDDCFVGVAQPGHPTAPLAVKTTETIERIPIEISSLDPDIKAPWTVDSWLSGTDPAMDAVAASVVPDDATSTQQEHGALNPTPINESMYVRIGAWD